MYENLDLFYVFRLIYKILRLIKCFQYYQDRNLRTKIFSLTYKSIIILL